MDNQGLEESKARLNPLAADYNPSVAVEETKHNLKADASIFEPGPAVTIESYETHAISHCKTSEKFDGRYGILNFVIGETFASYDPLEDSWVTYSEWSSKSKAPEAKYYRAIMISSTSFIITGGYSGLALKHSYHADISNNFGELINTLNVYEMNEARFLHSMVVYNSTVFIIGGQNSASNYLTSVEAFEGDSWVVKPSLNKPRSYFAVVTNNSGIWVAGGYQGSSEICQSIEKFQNNEWKLIEVTVPILAGMCTVPVDKFNSSFYFLGGSDGNKSYDKVLIFNTENSSFEEDSIRLLYPRAGAVACWYSNSFWIVGGGNVIGEEWTVANGRTVRETKPMPLSIYSQIDAATFMKIKE